MHSENPLVTWAHSQSMSYRQLAEMLDWPRDTIKKMAIGATGCSVERADQIEVMTRGKVKAIDMLRWHAEARVVRRSA